MNDDQLHPAALEVLDRLDYHMTRWPRNEQDVIAAGMTDDAVFHSWAGRIEIVNRGLVVGITEDMWDARARLLNNGRHGHWV